MSLNLSSWILIQYCLHLQTTKLPVTEFLDEVLSLVEFLEHSLLQPYYVEILAPTWTYPLMQLSFYNCSVLLVCIITIAFLSIHMAIYLIC